MIFRNILSSDKVAKQEVIQAEKGRLLSDLEVSINHKNKKIVMHSIYVCSLISLNMKQKRKKLLEPCFFDKILTLLEESEAVAIREAAVNFFLSLIQQSSTAKADKIDNFFN